MTRPDPAFWAGKRVLLTGHTGFKGSWAAVWLAQMGALVTGLSLTPDQTPALFDQARVASLVDSHVVDLRDQAAVESLVSARQFDLVLHMAAQPIVRTSIEDPVGTFASNIMGTAHLLQALLAQPALAAVLVVTSDKVYANNEQGRAFQETDALGGKDPYSASKAGAEIVSQSFARSFFETAGVPLATARGGNVIGGGDFSRDRLVADIVRAGQAQAVTVLRHPEATRPCSMSWTASPATSSIWSGWRATRPPRGPRTSARVRAARRSVSANSPLAPPRRWAPSPGATNPIPTRWRPAPSVSTPAWPARFWASRAAWTRPWRWTGPWTGTAPRPTAATPWPSCATRSRDTKAFDDCSDLPFLPCTADPDLP